jgi:hypothetical protein
MDLPVKEFWITSGAALVIHGVKEGTNDIDLGCTSVLWKALVERGFKFRETEDKSKIMIVSDLVEVIEEWYVDEIEYIEGLPVGSLESIKKQKLELGRAKDMEDIRRIDEYLENKK